MTVDDSNGSVYHLIGWNFPEFYEVSSLPLKMNVLSGLEISGDMVIGGMPHESHPPYLAEGLIKDLSVWNKPLSPEQVNILTF